MPGRKAGITTLLLKEINNNGKKLSFVYDAVGNIVTISENGVQKVKYTYNALSELTRVDSAWENKSITYTYDAGMNMTSRKEYSYTTGTLGNAVKTDLFTYRASGWKDQLISYNGSSISYDAVGNITAYQGKTLTWYRGSLLQSLTLNGKKTVYHYDSEGHRVQWKDLNGISHKNYWCGNKLMGTKYGDVLVQFVYGADKSPLMLKKGEKEYYYLYNSQNDVIGLIDSDGKQVVNYSYDAWGKQTGLTDTSGENIGKLNPFRYRAYCYDDDTRLYVTASRYYDPEVGRFVNADDLGTIFVKPQELGSKNLYAYCDNNPVAREDYAGEFPIPCIVGAVVGAAVSGFSYVLTSGGEIDGVELAKSCLVGAVSGALAPLDPMKWVVKPLVACAAVINGINTVVNTEGDIGTRLLCRTFEAGATYISGVTANNWTGGKVVLETVSAKIIGNAAVGYTVGQTAELAAIGLSAATNSGANASKKTNSATSNARTTKQSNTRVITTVSGRKKVIHKVKKPTRRNTKFQRVCMA